MSGIMLHLGRCLWADSSLRLPHIPSQVTQVMALLSDQDWAGPQPPCSGSSTLSVRTGEPPLCWDPSCRKAQNSTEACAMECCTSSSGHMRSPCWGVGRKALTWRQVQLVEHLELLCQVPMVHPTCGGRPARRHAGKRAQESHGQSIFEYLPFQWVLVGPSSPPDSLLERTLGVSTRPLACPFSGTCRPGLQQWTEGGEGRDGSHWTSMYLQWENCTSFIKGQGLQAALSSLQWEDWPGLASGGFLRKGVGTERPLQAPEPLTYPCHELLEVDQRVLIFIQEPKHAPRQHGCVGATGPGC